MKKKYWKWGLLILLAALLLPVFSVSADEKAGTETQESGSTDEEKDIMTKDEFNDIQSQTEDKVLKEIDVKGIDKVLKEIFPDKKVRFGDVLAALLDDGETISPKLIGDFVTDSLFYVVKSNKTAMMYLLLIVIVAAVFSNFSSVFQNRQIADISFYIVYILLITACLHTFTQTVDVVSTGIENIVTFMRVLGPAYFICMAISTGSVSAVAFYNIVLFLIYLVELVILHFLLPLIHVYLMMRVLNFLAEEDYLSKFAELLELLVGWSLKTLLACITGISVVQGLLSPAVDSVKRSAFTKGVEVIPGIGDAIGGVTEVILGTAVLVKNGIGLAGALICVGICIIPILNMGMLTIMYKLMAALIQPISDKRIVEALASVGNGYQMLLKVVFTTAVLFLLTIAVAAVFTS